MKVWQNWKKNLTALTERLRRSWTAWGSLSKISWRRRTPASSWRSPKRRRRPRTRGRRPTSTSPASRRGWSPSIKASQRSEIPLKHLLCFFPVERESVRVWAKQAEQLDLLWAQQRSTRDARNSNCQNPKHHQGHPGYPSRHQPFKGENKFKLASSSLSSGI